MYKCRLIVFKPDRFWGNVCGRQSVPVFNNVTSNIYLEAPMVFQNCKLFFRFPLTWGILCPLDSYLYESSTKCTWDNSSVSIRSLFAWSGVCVGGGLVGIIAVGWLCWISVDFPAVFCPVADAHASVTSCGVHPVFFIA